MIGVAVTEWKVAKMQMNILRKEVRQDEIYYLRRTDKRQNIHGKTDARSL